MFSSVLFQKLLQKDRLIGRDKVYLMVDEPLHVFGFVHSPSIDFHAQAVALVNPFGVLAEDFKVIVRTGASPIFQFLRGQVSVQVVDGRALRGEADEFFGGMT